MKYLELTLYKTRIYWHYGFDFSKLEKYFKAGTKVPWFNEENLTDKAGCVFHGLTDPDGWNSVIIWFKIVNPHPWVICHEVMHVVQAIFDYIEQKATKIDEVHCHLAEYIYCQTLHGLKHIAKVRAKSCQRK